MKLLTVDQIIEALKKDNIHITRDKFNYYSKIGLLFAPDKKMKKRVKEGIVSLYAGETIEDVKFIFSLKDKNFSLHEIKVALYDSDVKKLFDLYKEAGVDLHRKVDMTFFKQDYMNIESSVTEWRKGSYYQGLFTIYGKIVTNVLFEIDAMAHHIELLKNYTDDFMVRIQCAEDKKIVGNYLKEKIEEDNVHMNQLEERLSAFAETKFEPLYAFLQEFGIK